MRKPIIDRFLSKICRQSSDGCWLWNGSINNSGYGEFRGEKRITAHRWAYEYYIGKIPSGMQVLHKCDVSNCVNPAHLKLGTIQENCRDKMTKNRNWKKLTAIDVLKIRKIAKTKTKTYKEIGNIFKVTAQNICYIVNNKSWAFDKTL